MTDETETIGEIEVPKDMIAPRWKMKWWVVGLLIAMWVWLMLFYYLKADEITKNPCVICAEKMGENVMCSTGTYQLQYVYFYPNGSVRYEPPRAN